MMDKDQVHEKYGSMTYPELATAMREIAATKKDLKAQEAKLTRLWDVITIEVVPDKLAQDGFRSVNLDDGGQIRTSSQAYCSTREGMKGSLFAWLNENGFSELITEGVNASTLKAFVKEQRELGHEVPSDEIINYQPYIRATVVGGGE